MKRILHIISSIRGAESYSIKLGNSIIEKLQEKHPGSSVEEVMLSDMDIPHMTPATLRAFFTPEADLRQEDRALLIFSDQAVKQLLEADIIVIGAPLYNFSIPSSLKAWIDHVTRAGQTFKYQEGRPVGLVTGKQVYVAMASGGVYSEGPGENYDFVAPYLRVLLGFLGMNDVRIFRAEGVKIPGVMEHSLEKGISSIEIG